MHSSPSLSGTVIETDKGCSLESAQESHKEKSAKPVGKWVTSQEKVNPEFPGVSNVFEPELTPIGRG